MFGLSRIGHSEENARSDLARSLDSGVASVSSSPTDKWMGNQSGITPVRHFASLANPDAFYRTPGAFNYRRRHPHPKTEQDFVSGVPDDCLLRVANQLSLLDLINMMKTCKRFLNVGIQSSSWKHIDFGDKSVPAEVLERTILRGTTALRLNGTNITHPLPKHDGPITTYLTRIDATRLPSNEISRYMLTRLLLSSDCLTHLSLSGCDISLPIATHLSHIHRLSHLDLSTCENLTPFHLSLILSRSGTFIEELNVSCSRVRREGGMAIAKACSGNLLRLDLSGSAPPEEQNDSIDDEVVATLVKNCPSIWDLHLSDSPHLTARALHKIMTLRDLESLSLSRCYGIHPNEYLQAGRLSSLCVYGLLSDDGVSTLRDRLPDTHVNHLEMAISTVARPTTPPHVTALWGIKVKPFDH